MTRTIEDKCILTTLILFMLLPTVAYAADFIVEQRGKAFIYNGAKAKTLKVQVGDAVQFKNMDPYFHNVFSLSDTKLFDLGSYPQGESKSVTFDKAGIVEVECAIHPEMKMTVEVK